MNNEVSTLPSAQYLSPECCVPRPGDGNNGAEGAVLPAWPSFIISKEEAEGKCCGGECPVATEIGQRYRLRVGLGIMEFKPQEMEPRRQLKFEIFLISATSYFWILKHPLRVHCVDSYTVV